MSKKSMARALFLGILLTAENLGLEALFKGLPDVIGFVIKVLILMGTFYLLIQVRYKIEIPILSNLSAKEQIKINWLTLLIIVVGCLPFLIQGMIDYPSSLPDSLLYAMGAGIVCEYIFRGLFLQLALKDENKTHKQILQAVFLSSACFALVQSSPYWQESLSMILSQALYSLCIGIYAGALAIRCGHIGWGILLHSMISFSGIQVTQSTLSTPASLTVTPILSVALLFFSLYLLRPAALAADDDI